MSKKMCKRGRDVPYSGNSKYMCKECGRDAKKEKYLCKARKI